MRSHLIAPSKADLWGDSKGTFALGVIELLGKH